MKKGLLTKALSFLTAVCILTGSADLSVFAMEAGGGGVCPGRREYI